MPRMTRKPESYHTAKAAERASRAKALGFKRKSRNAGVIGVPVDNAQQKGKCARCLRLLGFPWQAIYPKLKMQKRVAIKYGYVANAPRQLKSVTSGSAEARKLWSLFRRIKLSHRRRQMAMRSKHFNLAMIAYYKNHATAKAVCAARARNKYKKCKYDPDYKMKRAMRNAITRIYRVYKTTKSRRTAYYFGATIQEVRAYIEKQFRRGMTWHNHGTEWEIDHRIPLAYFDLTEERQVLLANHFTNLQPLWKRLNREKSDRLEKHEHLALL